MKIRTVRHKGLRRFLEKDDRRGLPAQYSGKIIKMLAFLQDMQTAEELNDVPIWKAHQLTGDRAGVWSLHVSRNWRLTFQIDGQHIEIIELDYEDYH